MTKEQLELITAFLAGQQAAIVHLSVKLAERGDWSKSEIAESFRNTAKLLEEQTRHRDVISMVLNQIANGIDISKPENGGDMEEQIKKLLN
ncbi:TPA_asm: hypothetical protein GBZ67_22550 [Salmonella enterica subsp. diarizonae]|nr:hypothetical protein [Salmonella enterica subsp. diarizonae]ELI2368451.1 hypothetical protein [Salmonella enterica]HAB1617103.1 hypothetical protein [Salmonella enterica subsp. diarizonae]